MCAPYVILLTQYHPDKAHGDEIPERIRLINAAYETLRDPSARDEYLKRRAVYLAQNHAARPPRVADTVDIDAFDVVGDGDAMRLVYPCRCGQQYVLCATDLVEYLACSGCSEVIRVLYDSED